MSHQKKTSRRTFLKQCAALNTLGYSSIYSAIGGLGLTSQMAKAQTSRPSQYRAIVCVYLTGGNDLNMLIPTDEDNYNLYSQLRGSFALDRSNNPSGNRDVFLPISSGSGGSQRNFGLHPACGINTNNAGSGGFKDLYDDGNLAFIANTGSLLEPTTANQFRSESVNLPPSIGNHLIQKDFVRAGSFVNGSYNTGWAGRIADLFQIQQGGTPLNMTLLGDNIWQRGEASSTYSMSGASVRQPVGYRATGSTAAESLRRSVLDDVNNLSRDDRNLFIREYARIAEQSFNLSDALRDGAQDQAIQLNTVFPSTVLGNQMRSVAQLINARNGLDMDQQIFYLDSGGWDMHQGLLANHASNLEELSAAMAAFYAATVEMGLENQVLTFTNSDFGRTLQPNNNGSDHGWGGTQVVMGGRVNGGQVYGEFPMFEEGDGNGQFRDFRTIMVPSIATDQVSSTIAKWFGDFSDSTLNEIFPNVGSFNSIDLGFIS